MTQRQLQQNGYLYLLDEELLLAHQKAMRITQLLNNTPGTDQNWRMELVRELFGAVGEESLAESSIDSLLRMPMIFF